MWKPVLAALAVIAAVPASAAGVDAFDAHCADILILQAKPVQDELKVTKPQRDKMNVFATQHRERLAALEKEAKEKKTNPQAKLLEYYGQLKTNVLGQLSAAQVKRLRELSLQRVGLAALCDEVVAKKIGMTADQTTRMRKTYAEGAKRFSEAERAAIEPVLKPYEGKTAKTKEEAEKLNKEVQAKLAVVRKTAAPKLATIRTTYNARMKGILTSAQNKAYNALLGKPFKV